jgi:tetratricopeptide (TPR) repeat protein/predicted Ser/Thr protein kinase
MHLADRIVADFVGGRLDEPGIGEVEEHLDGCASCRKVVAELSRSLAVTPGEVGGDPLLLPIGSRIQRYRIEEVLGRGASGVVYAARDLDLDRRVALKLLRADAPGEAGREQMIREARAMARLDHPNVVTVHEVGAVDASGDETYIAMELVEGVSLRAWLGDEPRSWRLVLPVLIGAGRGLAAAHAAGIWHRDFKPDNVLIGRDGRARVGDFGLASGRQHDAPVAGSAAAAITTETGVVGGTPLYMAPERLEGGAADGRSDQFSFSVSLFEALCGQRPFGGQTIDELYQAMRAGQVAATGAPIPTALRRIVERGLAADPGARWPSMDAMLEALVRVEGRRARWLRAASIAGLALAAAGVTAVALSLGSDDGDRCAGAATGVEAVWSSTRARALEESLTATGLPYARHTADELARRAGAFAADWTRMRRAACEAAEVSHQQSPELYDRRMACLDRRLGELDALIGALVDRPAPASVENAARAAASLTPIAACGDTDALLAAVPPPADPATRTAALALRQRISRAIVLIEVNGTSPMEVIDPIVAEARRLEYPPVLAEALYLEAAALASGNQLPAAEQSYQQALELAAAARDHQLVARIWTSLLYLVGGRQQRFDDALAMRRAAEAAVAQAGGAPLLRADLHQNLGVALDLAGKLDEARAQYQRSLEINRAERPDDHRIGDALHNLGSVAWTAGDPEAATAHYQEALAEREARFGAAHPKVAETLVGLGAVARDQKQYDQARARYQRAIAILEAALGRDHPQVGAALNNLAIVCEHEKRFDEAEAHHRRAMAIRVATYGAEHPLVAQSLSNLGNLAAAQNQLDEARDFFARSVAMRERVLPEGHPGRAIAMLNLAGVHSQQGRLAEAVDLNERALAIFEAVPGGNPLHLATVRFNLARDLWRLSRAGRKRAVSLARSALGDFQRAGEARAAEARDVAAWLASR